VGKGVWVKIEEKPSIFSGWRYSTESQRDRGRRAKRTRDRNDRLEIVPGGRQQSEHCEGFILRFWLGIGGKAGIICKGLGLRVSQRKVFLSKIYVGVV